MSTAVSLGLGRVLGVRGAAGHSFGCEGSLTWILISVSELAEIETQVGLGYT